MKKFIIACSALLSLGTAFSQGGTQSIRFTGKKTSSQTVDIYAKNVTAGAISGALGASLLTLSVGVPASVNPDPTAVISSPIAGQTFDAVIKSDSGTTTIYSWNGTGSTAAVDFAPGVEVKIATVTFTGLPDATPVKLLMVKGGGPSFFDVSYIAPGGVDRTDYSNPFYSNIPADPGLINCNSVNDASNITCTSILIVTDIIVPVHFLSFFAIKNGDDAKLNWTVENDQDNNYFEVQRSLNGITYSTITKVNAMKNGRSSNTYELADPRLSGLGSTNVYYRIKQVDNNGTITYSQIRNLNLSLNLDALNLYPNPAKTTTKLVWDVQNAGKGTLIIRDALGRQVQTISLELVKGINQKDINVSMLPSGDYTVTALGTNFSKTIKLSKIN